MASYKINKINLPSIPSGTQTVTVEYKLHSQSISSYVVLSSSVNIGTDGVPASLLEINPVTAGETYDIRTSNNCQSPLEYWVETVPMS